jgi:alanyl-tRNA synthetase
MKFQEIKNKYIQFHNSNGYQTLPDSGIIPPDDSTLFTTSGMQQLRDHYENPFEGWPRLTSSQSCLRTVDFNRVGLTNRHLSFFTMLGCFDWNLQPNQVPEILGQSWKLLTEIFELDPEKLVVTVYGGDPELGYQKDNLTYNSWIENKIPESKIYLGGSDNYWQLGPDSVGGPCTEIFYDQGYEKSCRQTDCDPFCDCDRYLEIYNLVFTQYRHHQNQREHLGCLNLDTGLGLERLTMLLQQVDSIQEIDVYDSFQLQIKPEMSSEEQVLTKQLLDLLRSTCYLLELGVQPSNTGHGYMVRRFIRRTVHLGRKVGLTEQELKKKLENYSLQENLDLTSGLLIWDQELGKIEQLFKRGRRPVEKLLQKSSNGLLNEIEYQNLWETNGLPKDIVNQIIEEIKSDQK